MADRSNETLVIYDKKGTKVVEGELGTKSATITGLAAGTVVADGDYQVAFKDATTSKESDKVDVKGFTVLTSAPETPTDESSTPTNNGASVKAE